MHAHARARVIARAATRARPPDRPTDRIQQVRLQCTACLQEDQYGDLDDSYVFCSSECFKVRQQTRPPTRPHCPLSPLAPRLSAIRSPH